MMEGVLRLPGFVRTATRVMRDAASPLPGDGAIHCVPTSGPCAKISTTRVSIVGRSKWQSSRPTFY